MQSSDGDSLQPVSSSDDPENAENTQSTVENDKTSRPSSVFQLVNQSSQLPRSMPPVIDSGDFRIHPRDLFRNPPKLPQRSQPQQPFFNILNNQRGGTSVSKLRQPDSAPHQSVFQPGQCPSSRLTSVGFLARGKNAYTSPRTPVPVVPRPTTLKHVTASGDVGTPSRKRQYERAVTPNLAGGDNADVDYDELAVKMFKENKALKAELVLAQTHAQNLSSKIDSLQDEIASQKDESNKHIASLRTELSSAHADLSSARQELSSVKAALNSHQRDLSNTSGELTAYRDQNVALTSTNQELERYQSNIRAKLDASRKSLMEFRNDYSGLMASFTELKRSYDITTTVVDSLSTQVAEYKIAARDALKKLESISDDPLALAESRQVKVVLDDLKDTLAESYRTNDLLRDKLHLHLGQIVDLNDKIKSLENEKHEALDLLFVQKEQQIMSEKLGTRMEELAERLIKREHEAEVAQADVTRLNVELRAIESKNTDLERRAADYSVRLNMLTAVQDKLHQAQTENDVLKKWLAEKDNRIIALEQSTVDQLAEYRKLIDSLEKTQKKNDEEKASLHDQVQQAQKQFLQIRDTLITERANAEKQKYQAGIERAEEVKALEASLMEVKSSLAAKVAELHAIDSTLTKAKQEIRDKDTALKRMKQKTTELNILEERFEAQAATLRLSKEQCGDLQGSVRQMCNTPTNTCHQDTTNKLRTELEVLQRQLEIHRDTATELKGLKEILNRTSNDLIALRELFDAQTKELQDTTLRLLENQTLLVSERDKSEFITQELGTMKNQITEYRKLVTEAQSKATTKAENLVKSQTLLDSERTRSESLTQELSKATNEIAEKCRLLTEAQNRTLVLEDRLGANQATVQVMKGQLEALQEKLVRAENKYAGLLAVSEEQRLSLQASIIQARKDAVDQRILLDERLSKQELASERLLDAQQKRADTAENETKQAMEIADLTRNELQQSILRQKDTEKRLEQSELELHDAKIRIQNALVDLQSAETGLEYTEKERLLLQDRLKTAESQILNLKDANQSLVARGRSLQERYDNGDLSDQEKHFVQFIVSTTQSIHESELVEKLNEIRRRDTINNSLQERIRTLESMVARMLRERGTEVRPELKSLVNLSLWMSSSPQEGLNSVDVQIPTVDSLHLNTVAAVPISPREDTPFKSKTDIEMKTMDPRNNCKEIGQTKQAPTFGKLSEEDSGDDDIPLSELTRLSPTPVQATNKRGRAPSPALANVGRPARRSRVSGSNTATRQTAQSPKASKKAKAKQPKQKKQT